MRHRASAPQRLLCTNVLMVHAKCALSHLEPALRAGARAHPDTRLGFRVFSIHARLALSHLVPGIGAGVCAHPDIGAGFRVSGFHIRSILSHLVPVMWAGVCAHPNTSSHASCHPGARLHVCRSQRRNQGTPSASRIPTHTLFVPASRQSQSLCTMW